MVVVSAQTDRNERDVNTHVEVVSKMGAGQMQFFNFIFHTTYNVPKSSYGLITFSFDIFTETNVVFINYMIDWLDARPRALHLEDIV